MAEDQRGSNWTLSLHGWLDSLKIGWQLKMVVCNHRRSSGKSNPVRAGFFLSFPLLWSVLLALPLLWGIINFIWSRLSICQQFISLSFDMHYEVSISSVAGFLFHRLSDKA